jgi:hypothetical protein
VAVVRGNLHRSRERVSIGRASDHVRTTSACSSSPFSRVHSSFSLVLQIIPIIERLVVSSTLPLLTFIMPAKDWVILLLTHPLEFKTLVQFWLYHQKADRDIEHESQWKHTAYNRGTMKRCWEFLDLTSRSFAAVIKELDGDLARTVSICI